MKAFSWLISPSRKNLTWKKTRGESWVKQPHWGWKFRSTSLHAARGRYKNAVFSYITLLSHLALQLVGGEFDLETNFIIQDAESIGCMVELLEHCDVTCQAEIWSMFTAILRKSVRNLQTSTEVGLIQQVLLKMNSVDDMIAGMIMVWDAGRGSTCWFVIMLKVPF